MDSLRVAFTVPLPLAAAQAGFPPLDTWLRLSPQWEVLDVGADTDGEWPVRVRYERSEREVGYRTHFEAPAGEPLWRLTLAAETETRVVELQFEPQAGGTRIELREAGIAADDQDTRVELALWHRSSVDYLQLAARGTPGARLTKTFLDRVWLRMGPSGRRLAFLVVAFDGLALALFLLWILWYWLVN